MFCAAVLAELAMFPLPLLLLLVPAQGEESLDIRLEARHGEVFSIQLNASLLSGAADVSEFCTCSHQTQD